MKREVLRLLLQWMISLVPDEKKAEARRIAWTIYLISLMDEE